jgi:hypothetical protein
VPARVSKARDRCPLREFTRSTERSPVARPAQGVGLSRHQLAGERLDHVSDQIVAALVVEVLANQTNGFILVGTATASPLSVSFAGLPEIDAVVVATAGPSAHHRLKPTGLVHDLPGLKHVRGLQHFGLGRHSVSARTYAVIMLHLVRAERRRRTKLGHHDDEILVP